MSSIFQKIIEKKIPAYIIAENDFCIAFLDIHPIALGHTLIVPKKQTDYLFDLDDHIFVALHVFTKKIALAIDYSVDCLRVGMAVVGLEVPHAHIHLVPLQSAYDIDFKKQRLCLSSVAFEKLAQKIKKNIT